MTQLNVRVVSGTGAQGVPQVNITGASWAVSIVDTDYVGIVGPTGSAKIVQAINTGPSGGQEIKTVQIAGYVSPA